MSNYNEVADRLDNERLLASLGDRQLAASVLRSVASANADAEKCFDVWWKDYWDEYFNEAGAKHIYLAGHAARQAEVDALRAELATAREECERLRGEKS